MLAQTIRADQFLGLFESGAVKCYLRYQNFHRHPNLILLNHSLEVLADCLKVDSNLIDGVQLL